jgi:hypothetical protein
MQQPQLTTYADITEVRTVSGATACNQLLADGWVLLGVYPLTTVAEMQKGNPVMDRSRESARTPSGMCGGWLDMSLAGSESKLSQKGPFLKQPTVNALRGQEDHLNDSLEVNQA